MAGAVALTYREISITRWLSMTSTSQTNTAGNIAQHHTKAAACGAAAMSVDPGARGDGCPGSPAADWEISALLPGNDAQPPGKLSKTESAAALAARAPAPPGKAPASGSVERRLPSRFLVCGGSVDDKAESRKQTEVK